MALTRVLSSLLTNTSVSSGTYGGASAIPVIAINSEGQITSASNVVPSFSASSSAFAVTLQNAVETANLIGSAVNSAATAYFNTGAVQYYTTNAGATWTQNLTYSSGTTMASALAVGQSATIAIMVTQGSSGASYYPTAVNIDGGTSGVTTYWQGGSAPTKGYASGIDVYTYTIVKTASTPTYTVLASQTQF